MEKTKKSLRETSILVLLFAALSLVRMVFNVIGTFTNLDPASIPEGATEGIVIAGAVIVCVIGVLMLVPQLYVGLKGLKAAKEPVSTRAHIVWAKVLIVFAALDVVSAVSAMIKDGNILTNALTLCDGAVDLIVFFTFVKLANQVYKAR